MPSSIDLDLQRALIATLPGAPGIEDPRTCTALIHGVRVAVSRSYSDPRTDLVSVVRYLERADPAPILTVSGSAIDHISEGPLMEPLHDVCGRVEAVIGGDRPGTVPNPVLRSPPSRDWSPEEMQRSHGALAELFATTSTARMPCQDARPSPKSPP